MRTLATLHSPLTTIRVSLRGIFIISELTGPLAERIRAIQERFDPKMARLTPPHVTIAGSSGTGVIEPRTTAAELHAALDPIVATTPPLTLHFGPPTRFMQTNIVSLPLDPHGPLRALHERIAASGLRFEQARFAFTPHCTLSFYPTLTPERLRELLSIRIPEPVVLDRIEAYYTANPQPARKLYEGMLGGDRGSGE
jgi:2'-5' RNA ligase